VIVLFVKLSATEAQRHGETRKVLCFSVSPCLSGEKKRKRNQLLIRKMA